MKKVIAELSVGICFVIGSLFFKNGLKDNILASGITLIGATVIIDIIFPILSDIRNIKNNFVLMFLKIGNKDIRFSMSYLYRIKIDDKYLLVKNSHWESYQFVGGKYQVNPEAKSVFLRLGIKDDKYIPLSTENKMDLAVIVPARNVKRFLNWYNSQKDREISHWREFYEELIIGKKGGAVLSRENFSYVNYRYLGNVQTPIKRASAETGWQCWEMLSYDILEPILSTAQEKELRDIKDHGDNEYIKWASDALIEKCGYEQDRSIKKYQIGIHTKWAKNLKWSKE